LWLSRNAASLDASSEATPSLGASPPTAAAAAAAAAELHQEVALITQHQWQKPDPNAAQQQRCPEKTCHLRQQQQQKQKQAVELQTPVAIQAVV
jgi:hypothetical protein